MTAILGLNAFHGDAAAALVIDGELVNAVEEERLNRVKHCAGFPELAAAYERALALPFHTTLTDHQVDRVTEALRPFG